MKERANFFLSIKGKQMFSLVLFLILNISNVFSQSGGCDFEIDEFEGIVYMAKNYELTDKNVADAYYSIKQRKKCLKETKNNTHRAQMNSFIAAKFYYINEELDTVKYYVNKSIDADPVWFWSTLEEQKQLAKKQPKFYSTVFEKYFLIKLQEQGLFEEIDSSVFNITNQNTYTESVELSYDYNEQYREALSIIKDRDQSYRDTKEKMECSQQKSQEVLDRINRIQIDSLYNLYGFPTKKITGNKSSALWLVLQHSKDCEWNKKWIRRYLDSYKKGETKAELLSFTFDRFYNKKNGYCRGQDEKSSNEFIQFLKANYPSEYGETFGYKDY